jgi:hypothetical protein
MPPTVHGEAAPDGYKPTERGERVETFDPSTNSPEEVERMQTVFTLLERALVARKQYGEQHPEVKRRFDECFKQLASALMSCDICLAWNFTPYAFTAGDNVVWEPEPPWNRIPYQLFSDGVRTMGLVPGLDEAEFSQWVSLITIDPTLELAPEDDLVTSLWDAGFEHVFHQAVDSFAEGNQDQRAQFDVERNAVINGAHADPVRDAAQAWRQGQADGGVAAHNNAGAKTRQVVDFINKSTPLDAEAAARVANMDLQEQTAEEAQASVALMLDESTRALLAARLDMDVRGTSERFIVAAAEAFVASAKMGRSQAVTAPLRRAVDGLCAGEPEKAMDMIVQLREAVQVEGQELETDTLRDTITAEILSPRTLLDILKGSNSLADDRRQTYLDGLSKVLECIQSQHFESAINFLPESPPGKIRVLLLDFMRRAGPGHEATIGAQFATADLELGLDLVRLLVAIDSDAARESISMASSSPHPLVRIEALGQLEGVSGPRVRAELRRLLEDDELDVRLAALRAMADYGIAAAGPFLVLRMQDKSFLKLPFDEREQCMQTLAILRPKRCEEVCIALLQDSRLLRPSALETTRELAAQFLAEVGSGNGALQLLETIANSKPWSNSKSIREATATAALRLKARLEELVAAQKALADARRSVVEPASRGTGIKKKKKTGRKTAGTKTSGIKPTASKAADDAADMTAQDEVDAPPVRTGEANGQDSTAPDHTTRITSAGGD